MTMGGSTLEDVRRLMALATGDEKHDESSTSTLDALWVLHDRVLRLNPTDPTWEGRDRFILSKGHGPVAYYAILAAKGFFPASRGWTASWSTGAALGSHPDRNLVPGVEASTGSLGHGLPMAVGVAAAVRAKRLDARVVVLCGDAELNEGTNWEAALLAPHLRLGNLTLLVIENHSSSIEMGPWDAKLRAFGWAARVVDGHDHAQLEEALGATEPDIPTAVVADIPRGEW